MNATDQFDLTDDGRVAGRYSIAASSGESAGGGSPALARLLGEALEVAKLERQTLVGE